MWHFGLALIYALCLFIPMLHVRSNNIDKSLLLDELHSYHLHKFLSNDNSYRNGRRLIESRGERKLSYEFEAFDKVFNMELTRDDELFSNDYKHYYVVPDEKDKNKHNFVVDDEVDTKCLYKVKFNDDPASMGSISLCGTGMRGLLHHSEVGTFHIQPIDEIGDSHAIYRSSDVKNTKGGKCGVQSNSKYDSLGEINHFHSEPNNEHIRSENKPKESISLKNDESSENNGGERRRLGNGPAKLIRLVVVNDNERFKQFGNSVHAHAAQMVASMDALYSTISGSYTFDIQIVGMYTYSHKDPYTLDKSSGFPTADEMLENFDAWRADGGQMFPNDYSVGMMFTGYELDGNTIGLAYVSGACVSGSKSSIVQAFNLADSLVVAAAAHELGHNLGMQHDDKFTVGSLVPEACFSPNDPHIMDSSRSEVAATKWSTCSANWVKQHFEGYNSIPKKYDTAGAPSCMEKCFIGDANPPAGCTPVASWPSETVCGDGFKQGTEECDCPNRDCTDIDPCCDASTCKLKVGSKCSALDGCCSSCQIVTDTTKVCRTSLGECDNEEKCDGVNAACPVDTFKQTGVPCQTTTPVITAGICYYKECKAHFAQCMEYSGQGSIPVFDADCSSADNDDGDLSCQKLSCKPASANSCEQFITVFVEDGTQCKAGSACYGGVCTSYAKISIPGASNCTNGQLDDGEVNTDCGGPLCFGCEDGAKCLHDRDCIYPSRCNITDQAKENAKNSNTTAEGICNGSTNASLCAPCPTDKPTNKPTQLPTKSSSEENKPKSFFIMVMIVGLLFQFLN